MKMQIKSALKTFPARTQYKICDIHTCDTYYVYDNKYIIIQLSYVNFVKISKYS